MSPRERAKASVELMEALLTNQEKQEIIQEPSTLDCQKCGACCLPDKPQLGELAWIMVFEVELEALGKEREEFYTEPDHGKMLLELGLEVETPVESIPGLGRVRLMRARTDGQGIVRCKALAGEPGRKCACAIYETRPRICRSVEKGSLSCLCYRRQYHWLLMTRQEKIEV